MHVFFEIHDLEVERAAATVEGFAAFTSDVEPAPVEGPVFLGARHAIEGDFKAA
jgi:hypothetical protein